MPNKTGQDGLRHSLAGAAAALALSLGLIALPVRAMAGDWLIDYDASRITFTAKQMGVPAEGEFKKFTVDLTFDRERLNESRAVVVVDIASAKTAYAEIETELKKAKWFDVAQHPTGRFEIVSFRRGSGDRLDAVAKLTLRGVTKDVVLPFSLTAVADPANPGGTVAQAKGEIEIKRLDYGIGQDEWRNTNVVADEVLIRIDLRARRRN